jgi:hypothetical protein
LIKGDGGDPGNKGLRITAWINFDESAFQYAAFNRLNKWNRDAVFVAHGNSKVVKREQFTQDFAALLKALVEDKNRLALVTKECFDVMKLIEDKIDYVNITKYKDDKENEWKYYQFGKNE